MSNFLNDIRKLIIEHQIPVKEQEFKKIYDRIRQRRKRRGMLLFIPLIGLGLGFFLIFWDSNPHKSKDTNVKSESLITGEDQILTKAKKLEQSTSSQEIIDRLQSTSETNRTNNNLITEHQVNLRNKNEVSTSSDFHQSHFDTTSNQSIQKFNKSPKPGMAVLKPVPLLTPSHPIELMSLQQSNYSINHFEALRTPVRHKIKNKWSCGLLYGLKNQSVTPNLVDDVHYLHWDIAPWNVQNIGVDLRRKLGSNWGVSVGYLFSSYQYKMERLIPAEGHLYLRFADDKIQALPEYKLDQQELSYQLHRLSVGPFAEMPISENLIVSGTLGINTVISTVPEAVEGKLQWFCTVQINWALKDWYLGPVLLYSDHLGKLNSYQFKEWFGGIHLTRKF